MQTFAEHSDAKAAAERIVRDAADGSQAAVFSASQSRDALATFASLESPQDAPFRCWPPSMSLSKLPANCMAVSTFPII
ncbi:MAG: hypothetical protein ABSF34_11660 [Verrucomicrobiota bacterium]